MTDKSASPRPPGETARAAGWALTSCRVAALPILDRLLRRLRLEEFLRGHLPVEDRRTRVPTATGLLVLIKDLLISRAPLYGVGSREEWGATRATGTAPSPSNCLGCLGKRAVSSLTPQGRMTVWCWEKSAIWKKLAVYG